MRAETRARAYETVDRLLEIPMLALSLTIIPLLLVPALIHVSSRLDFAITTANALIWAAFAFELLIKTYLSPSRTAYVRAHWFDGVIVVLPFLRPLRVVRSARAVRVFRATRIFGFAARSFHSAR